jgi:hypothetical protein
VGEFVIGECRATSGRQDHSREEPADEENEPLGNSIQRNDRGFP